MYRFSAIGSDCALPSECVQANARYPERVDHALLDSYCDLVKKGAGGQVEKMCLTALMRGEEYEKAPFETTELPYEGPGCQSDADCDNGLCEHGVCTSVSSESTRRWLAFGALGVLGALAYYRSRRAR